jgi:NADH dehydrogenase [ubiquinone] 1 alpha subcomplex assembly factor 2
MGILVKGQKVINFLSAGFFKNDIKLLSIFRKEPPTQDELKKNLAIMQMKKHNAKLLDDKFGTGNEGKDHASLKSNEKGKAEFPRYDEDFESVPGIKPIKKN